MLAEEEIISHHGNGGFFFSLIRRPNPDGDDEWSWFVQAATKTETVEEEARNEFEARAHYRNLCAEHGIAIPHAAPTFEVTELVEQAPAPAKSGKEYYARLIAELSTMNAGTDEATAFRDRMLQSEEFGRWSEFLFKRAEGNDGWKSAMIRSICKRRTAMAEAQERLAVVEREKEAQRLACEHPDYGMF